MPKLKRTAEQIALDIKNQQKQCCVCKTVKPFSEFYNYKNKNDNKSYRCKPCDDDARKKWKKNNPEKAHLSQRERNLKHRFGVDLDWYQTQLKKQNYCCAICKVKENNVIKGNRADISFAVDHCHKTGKIRGLLCNQCNRALGLFKDSSELITKAIEYLKRKKE
jgi:hypothetical protein